MIPIMIDNKEALSVANHPESSPRTRHICAPSRDRAILLEVARDRAQIARDRAGTTSRSLAVLTDFPIGLVSGRRRSRDGIYKVAGNNMQPLLLALTFSAASAFVAPTTPAVGLVLDGSAVDETACSSVRELCLSTR